MNNSRLWIRGSCRVNLLLKCTCRCLRLEVQWTVYGLCTLSFASECLEDALRLSVARPAYSAPLLFKWFSERLTRDPDIWIIIQWWGLAKAWSRSQSSRQDPDDVICITACASIAGLLRITWEWPITLVTKPSRDKFYNKTKREILSGPQRSRPDMNTKMLMAKTIW